jgi:carbonic anhydrase/acetyltransferase-like protein (isoleucine patch superfamily)
MSDLATKVRAAAAVSPLVRAAASIRRDGGRELALGHSGTRPLTSAEIEQLERRGNFADDWGRVLVADPFDPHRIRGCTFSGDVVLGRFSARTEIGSVLLPTGVYESTLSDCVIGHDALVHGVRLLAKYVVGPGAILFNCGLVTGGSNCRFGNGAVLRVGPQARPREVPAYAELDIGTAAAAARPHDRRATLDAYTRAVTEYAAAVASDRGIIERHASVQNVGRLERSYLGPACHVDGAAAMADCTLLSSEENPTRVGPGASMTTCLLQAGAAVGSAAVVDRSLFMDHAHAGRHAKVSDSILGPGTAVAVGEVTACLLGPLVSAHHQSLLISLVWPAGRGNVAHGANIGSNHTSRCADQECWPGEGVFFGLGVNVKFPANLSRAPYTMIAPGTTTAPQAVEYPFSLIAPAAPNTAGLPAEATEIRPGWVLGENLYALRRIEVKHRARYPQTGPALDLAVLRPDTIALMRVALHWLETVPNVRPFYTSRDCPGLGKNVLFEAARCQAIAVYRRAIAVYALTGLWHRVAEALESGEPDLLPELLRAKSSEPEWELQRTIINDDLGIDDPITGLARLPALLQEEAAAVEQSRAKDHVRGSRIIDDYFDHHEAPSDDDLVRAAAVRLEEDLAGIRNVLAQVRRARPQKSVTF